MRRFLLASTVMMCALPSLAEAHPHVWVTMRTDVVFTNDGKISGINLEWNFDDAYAQQALEGMDANGDGEYSQDELQPLTAENISSLKDYGYFNVMWGNGEVLESSAPIDAGQTYANKKLQLHFTVPLVKPYDPHTGEFKVKIFDPEFFIAFDYTADLPADTEGKISSDCKLDLKPLPSDAELTATQEMLATKGVDWKPEAGEDFGSMFAQALGVTCKS